MKKLDPITPGEFLLEELLRPMGLSQYRLAKKIGVPAQRISEIVSGKGGVTADTDLRLCRFFGLSNGYWLRAQAAYDTEAAERTMDPLLKNIKPWSKYSANKADSEGTRSLFIPMPVVKQWLTCLNPLRYFLIIVRSIFPKGGFWPRPSWA